MPDIIDEKVKISELDSIPSNWGPQVVKAFLTQKGLLAVADAEGLAGTLPDTYKVTMQELVNALGIEDISEAITIALGLKNGCASVAFVDTDKSSVTSLDDGKTLKYAFSSLAQALASNSTIIIVVGSSTKTEAVSNNINAKLIVNLNSSFSIELQGNTNVYSNLVVKSKGTVHIGALNYVNVEQLDVEASEITISNANVKTLLKANVVTFNTITNDSVISAISTTLNTVGICNVSVETDSLTFTNNNSVQGNFNAKASKLDTYPINVIGGNLKFDIGSIVLANSGTYWLSVNSSNGASVFAFIKEKPSFYDEDTGYKGYVVTHDNEIVKLTYAGIFPIIKLVQGTNIYIETQVIGEETTYTISSDDAGNLTIIDTTYTYNQVKELIDSEVTPILKRIVRIDNVDYEIFLPYSGNYNNSYTFGVTSTVGQEFYYYYSTISALGWSNNKTICLAKDIIASDYQENHHYLKDSVVWNDDVLYVATEDNTDASFDINHWAVTNVADLIFSKVSDAPVDDVAYVRKNGTWISSSDALEDNLTLIELPD